MLSPEAGHYGPLWVVRAGGDDGGLRPRHYIYVCVVPWSEFPIVPIYPHYPQPLPSVTAFIREFSSNPRIMRRGLAPSHRPMQERRGTTHSRELSGRDATRAENVPGTPTQSHILPSILVYADKIAVVSVARWIVYQKAFKLELSGNQVYYKILLYH